MRRTQKVFFVSLVLFVLLLFMLPTGAVRLDLGGNILIITTFLFGLIAGFYIIVTTTDYNAVKNALAVETASWIAFYQTMLIYDELSAKELREPIDAYIRRNFDYEVIDYTKSTHHEFEVLEKLIRRTPFKAELSSVHQVILQKVDDITTARQQLTVLGAKSLSLFQWMVLYTLATLLIATLYGLRTGDLFFDLVTVGVSSSVVLVLMLIHDLDLYLWNEQTFSFDIFQNVLRSIGELPYYPEETIANGRIIPREEKYRVGLRDPRTQMRRIEIRGATQ